MRVGTIVEIVGLQGRPEYNGLHAVVRSREETGRFKCVLVDASKTLLLKPENIKQVPLSELKPVQEPPKPAASAMTPNGKLALQLVKGAVMSSAWKLRSLQAGKKLCEGCDCHLNDPKKSPSTTTAGNVGHMLTADMLKGMDLPPETLAQFSAMMSDKSAPTIIGFDGLVEGGSVSVSPDAMLDEDIDKLVSNLNGGMYPWREKIHAVLRFRISGHIVEPNDFKDEDQLIDHFGDVQAAYDAVMALEVCEICLAPPLKCTGPLSATYDEGSQRELLLCQTCMPARSGEPLTAKMAAVDEAVAATQSLSSRNSMVAGLIGAIASQK